MIPKKKHLLGLLLLAWIMACCQGAGPVVTIQSQTGENLQIKVEIADTPAARERGLMFRENVPEGTGMLFIFPEENQTPFWMKNTPSSLDLIFIRSEKIVSLIENAAPYSEEMLIPTSSYTAVLEVPGGYAARHHVTLEDSVILPK